MTESSVTISKTRYDELILIMYKFRALEACGVEDWENFSEAMQIVKDAYNGDTDLGEEDE